MRGDTGVGGCVCVRVPVWEISVPRVFAEQSGTGGGFSDDLADFESELNVGGRTAAKGSGAGASGSGGLFGTGAASGARTSLFDDDQEEDVVPVATRGVAAAASSSQRQSTPAAASAGTCCGKWS